MTRVLISSTAQTQVSPERAEFRRLFNAKRLAEARSLAERCYAKGRERVAWVTSLSLVGMEEGNLREAYSLLLTHEELLSDCPDQYSVANYQLTYGIVSKRLYQLHNTEEYFDCSSIAFAGAAIHFSEAGRDDCAAYAENCYANLLIVSGRAADSFKHIDTAQLLFNNAGERARVADCEDTRALAYEDLGDHAAAFECSGRAVSALYRMGEAEAKSFEQARETHARVFARLSKATYDRIEGKVGTR